MGKLGVGLVGVGCRAELAGIRHLSVSPGLLLTQE